MLGYLSFNPCYSRIGFRRHPPVPYRCVAGVTILVILELALEAASQRAFASRWKCFNPCYSGIGIRRLIFKSSKLSNHCFNPCYSGIGFRRARAFGSISGHSPVSILVILELALEANHNLRSNSVTLGFNPCYSGIGFRRICKSNLTIVSQGFNPCYSGIGFRSICILSLFAQYASFNPCYSGIGFRSHHISNL